jgi:hypothetical protein
MGFSTATIRAAQVHPCALQEVPVVRAVSAETRALAASAASQASVARVAQQAPAVWEVSVVRAEMQARVVRAAEAQWCP